jgi:hypothetical protein
MRDGNRAARTFNPCTKWRFAPGVFNLETRRREVISFQSSDVFVQDMVTGCHIIGGWMGRKIWPRPCGEKRGSVHSRKLHPAGPVRTWAVTEVCKLTRTVQK